jgi:hypothetical protein
MDITKVPLPKDYQEMLTMFFYVVSEYGEVVEGHLDDAYVVIDKEGVIQFAKDYLSQTVLVEMVDDPDTGNRWYRVRRKTDVAKILEGFKNE